MARDMTGVGVTPSSSCMTVSHFIGGEHFERRALSRTRQRVGVLAHVQRTIGSLTATILTDGLGDRQYVGLGKRAPQRRSPVATGAEAHHLGGIAHIRPFLVIVFFQPREIYQQLLRGRLAGKGRDSQLLSSLQCPLSVPAGSVLQISDAGFTDAADSAG